MSEQAGTHSVPLGGAAEGPERAPEMATHSSAAVPFETAGYSERTRRGWKPWAIVGVAIAVPAAVAAALVVTLGGGGDAPTAQQAAPSVAAPTPIVEQAAAPPSVTAPQRATPVAPSRATTATAAAATATPATSAAAAPDRTSSAAETTTQTATTAAAAPAATAELATPEERLGAWPEMVQVTIVEGDSLWALANEYETTVEAISMLNAIAEPSELAVGDVVTIPVGFAEALTAAEAVVVEESSASGGEAAEAAATQFAVTPAADTPLSEWPNTVEWTLQQGDSLSGLAITFETTPEAIMTLNAIEDPNLVFAGTTIVIPVGYSGAAGEGESVTEPETTTQQAAVTTTESEPSSGSETGTTTQTMAVNPASLDDSNEGVATTTQSMSTDDGSEGASDGDYLEGDAVTTTTTTTTTTASDDGDYLEGDPVTTTAQSSSSDDGGDYLEE